MKSIWFTADTHFGHENIIRFCGRPYSDVDEMNEALVDNWNNVVRPNDDVYHLGDFVWNQKSLVFAHRLNGTIRVVPGNHDATWLFDHFERLPEIYWMKVGGHRSCLCHYALRSWVGRWQLHGHTHGTLEPQCGQLDVGVDGPLAKQFPLNAEQIVEHFRRTPDIEER